MSKIDPIIFVTAIDTGTGKSVVTGLLAAYLSARGCRVITQKLAQTGCVDFPEDLRTHRELMGVQPFAEDTTGDTCPYVFELPASPHLAARQAGAEIDVDRIRRATDRLSASYDVVLVEGVGGLCVPLTERTTILDYVAARAYPVVLVSSARLGSINHTLLSLELLHRYGLDVLGVAFNHHAEALPEIARDSRRLFVRALEGLGYPGVVIDIPELNSGVPAPVEFDALFA